MELLIIGGVVLLVIFALFNRKPSTKKYRVQPTPPPTTVTVKSYSAGQYYFFTFLAFGIYFGLSYLTVGISVGQCSPAYDKMMAFFVMFLIHVFALAFVCKAVLPKAFWTYGSQLNETMGHSPILKFGVFAGFMFSVYTHYAAATAC